MPSRPRPGVSAALRKEKRKYEVVCDGQKLHFPTRTSTRDIEQARRNAADRGRELTSATGEPVKVKAILTFPGWCVKRTGKADIYVLNPKEIRQVVLANANHPPQLSPAQLQRIAYQVERRCRDVEF